MPSVYLVIPSMDYIPTAVYNSTIPNKPRRRARPVIPGKGDTMKQKSLIDLLIELDTIEKRLDRIRNDPEYIKGEAARVFGNKAKQDHTAAINKIIDMYA